MDHELRATYQLGRFHGKLLLSQLSQLRGCIEYLEALSFLVTESNEMTDEAATIAEAQIRTQAVQLADTIRQATHTLCTGAIPVAPEVAVDKLNNVTQLRRKHNWGSDGNNIRCHTCGEPQTAVSVRKPCTGIKDVVS